MSKNYNNKQNKSKETNLPVSSLEDKGMGRGKDLKKRREVLGKGFAIFLVVVMLTGIVATAANFFM